MNTGGSSYNKTESEIYRNMTLYKPIQTNKGQIVLLHNDGAVSLILKLTSINVNSYTEEDFERMFFRIKQYIERLDDGVTVQFSMVREKASKEYLNFNKLPSYLSPRGDMLRMLANQNRLFDNSYYLSIFVKSENEAAKKDGLIKSVVDKFKNRNNAAHNLNKAALGIEKRVSTCIETAASMAQMMDTIHPGASADYLKSYQEYWDVLQKFTRPNKSKFGVLEIDDKDMMTASPRQALFSGVRAEIRKNDFTLDDYFHKIYTLDRAPRQLIYGRSLQVLDSLPYELVYSVSFRKMIHAETLNKFKFAVGLSRAIDGTNEDAIIEDLTKTANARRIYEHYVKFAEGDGAGIEMSANLCLRVAEEFIERSCSREGITREEYVSRLNNQMEKSVFSQFGASEWASEPNIGWFVYNQMIPGMSNVYQDIMKKNMVLSVDLPYFLSFYDNKIPNIIHNGVNHFIDLKDNMIPFDLNNPNLPAWNYSISGQTGSGKSVLINTILTMQFAEEGKRPTICILDVGGDQGSYAKFMEMVEGTQINLSGATKPKIQMLQLYPERSIPTIKKRKELVEYFKDIALEHDKMADERAVVSKITSYYDEILKAGGDKLTREGERAIKEIFEDKSFGFPYKSEYLKELTLKPGQCRPSSARLTIILGLLEVIISSSGKDLDGFEVYDPDEITGFIYDVYEIVGATENRFPMLSDLYKMLKDGELNGVKAEHKLDPSRPDARKLLKKIQNWTIDGQYGMFDQNTDIDMNNSVILADLKGLEGDLKLQMMYTLLISQLFQDKMYFTRGRKLIIRDEAWSLMKNEKAREFFIEDLRTARKNGFATISASQLPDDYKRPDGTVEQGIISNMQVQIFCKFNTDTICRRVGQEFGLSPESIEQLTRLGVVKERQADGSLRPMYATFMMKIDKDVYVFKNQLHPFEYQLYNSSAEDNAIVYYYRQISKQFKSLEEVLWFISNGNHKGDRGLAEYLKEYGYANAFRAVWGNQKL